MNIERELSGDFAPKSERAARVALLLAVLPVEDLTVEDVEIESVIRDLFSQKTSASSEEV